MVGRFFSNARDDKKKARDTYLKGCKLAFRHIYGGILEVNEAKIPITKDIEIASGGFKTIYDIGNGKVIALRNFSVDSLNEDHVLDWVHAVNCEWEMADRLRQLGLYAQDYQKIEVKINNHEVPALLMTHFKQLERQGLFIRGHSANEKFGSSLIFGCYKNLIDDQYLRKLFKHLINDIIILIANKVNLPSSDSMDTLVIRHTNNTLRNIQSGDTVLDCNQELHFYFTDFFQKQCFFMADDIEAADERFNPNMHEIFRFAKLYLNRAHSALVSAVTKSEINILQANNPNINIIDIMNEMFENAKESLLEEITHGVLRNISQQNLTQFNHSDLIKRCYSTLSYFSDRDTEADDDDEDYEELFSMDKKLRSSA